MFDLYLDKLHSVRVIEPFDQYHDIKDVCFIIFERVQTWVLFKLL